MLICRGFRRRISRFDKNDVFLDSLHKRRRAGTAKFWPVFRFQTAFLTILVILSKLIRSLLIYMLAQSGFRHAPRVCIHVGWKRGANLEERVREFQSGNLYEPVTTQYILPDAFTFTMDRVS